MATAALVPLSFAQTAPPAPPRARSAGVAVQNSSYLGVGIMDVDAAGAKALKLKEERGAEVTEVDPSSPAGKAGVKVGDVVLEYNGQPVQNKAQLQTMIRETPPGHEAKLSIWRNGAAQSITATIESRRMVTIAGEPWYAVEAPAMPPMPAMAPMPPMPNMDFDIPRIQAIMKNSILGIAGEPLGDEQQFAEFFGVKDGVLVKAVDSNSAAERAGIKAGDVIVKVGDTRVGSLRELAVALRTARSKGAYTVIVVRNKKEMPLTVNPG
jgi:serine protease Do